MNKKGSKSDSKEGKNSGRKKSPFFGVWKGVGWLVGGGNTPGLVNILLWLLIIYLIVSYGFGVFDRAEIA